MYIRHSIDVSAVLVSALNIGATRRQHLKRKGKGKEDECEISGVGVS